MHKDIEHVWETTAALWWITPIVPQRAARVTIQCFTYRGILLQEQKRYEEAIESYMLALQCRPRLSSKYFQF